MAKNHRIVTDVYPLVHWKNGVACSSDDNPDRVELQINGSVSLPSFSSASDPMLQNILFSLDRAFALGRENMQSQLRRLIGVNT